jgi:hypothetical protein
VVAASWGTFTGSPGPFWTGFYHTDSDSPENGHFVIYSDSSQDRYAPDVDNQEWRLGTSVANNSTVSTYQNGESVQENVTRTIRNAGPLFLGCYVNQSLFFQGEIAEVLVIDDAQTSIQRQAVDQYLLSKYGGLQASPAGVLSYLQAAPLTRFKSSDNTKLFPSSGSFIQATRPHSILESFSGFVQEPLRTSRGGVFFISDNQKIRASDGSAIQVSTPPA